MNEFAAQLLRLKQALGLIEDQDVAEALGMSKAAFSDRKRRNAFPAEKLRAIAAVNAKWQLDVDYVLTGDSARKREQQRRLDAIGHGRDVAMRIPGLTTAQRAAVLDEVAAGDIGALSVSEQQLLGDYRRADDTGRAIILASAAAAAAATVPNAQAPPTKKPPTGHQTFHGDVGQVVHAEGDIRNKKQVFNVGTRKEEMSEQHFGDVGQVQITNNGNIVNEGASIAMLEQQREARWTELHARQQRHLKARAVVEHRSRWNVYVAALVLIVLGQVACVSYGLHLGIHGAERLWPVTMSLIVLMGIDAWFLQRHRNECVQAWHYHNDAIAAINNALAVL